MIAGKTVYFATFGKGMFLGMKDEYGTPLVGHLLDRMDKLMMGLQS